MDDVCEKPSSVGPSWPARVKTTAVPTTDAFPATTTPPAQSQPAGVNTFVPGGTIVKPVTSAGITHSNALSNEDIVRLMAYLDGKEYTVAYAMAFLNIRHADMAKAGAWDDLYAIAAKQLELAGVKRCFSCDRWFRDRNSLSVACVLCR